MFSTKRNTVFTYFIAWLFNLTCSGRICVKLPTFLKAVTASVVRISYWFNSSDSEHNTKGSLSLFYRNMMYRRRTASAKNICLAAGLSWGLFLHSYGIRLALFAYQFVRGLRSKSAVGKNKDASITKPTPGRFFRDIFSWSRHIHSMQRMAPILINTTCFVLMTNENFKLPGRCGFRANF